MKNIQLNQERRLELSEGPSLEGLAFDHVTGTIFHLNKVGVVVVRRLQSGNTSLDELIETVAQHFEHPRDLVRADLVDFLRELRAESLVAWEE